MNRPEDFEPHCEQTNNQADDDLSPNGTHEEAPKETQWYGISYQNQNSYYTAPPVYFEGAPQKGKSRKIIAVALLLVLCMALSLVAGFVGTLLANRVIDESSQVPNNTANGPIANPSGEIYGTDGDSNYNYGDVILDKNDGSGLVGSKNGSAGENAGNTITAAAIAKNAVVEITTTVESNRGTMQAGAGSGVIIHKDGIIVTNNHVIEGADKVYVRLTNGNTYQAVVRGTDEDGDIAVIKIQPRETLTVAKLGYSGALVEGEPVIAIGNPLGQLGGTVTEGVVSALERQVQIDGVTMTLIQTSAAINSGNSGGGLFNMAGELIGVVNAKYAAEGVEGLDFAIPIDSALVSINHLLKLGYIPGIPALGADVTDYTYSNVVMPYVSSAATGSGLQQGDYIYKIGDTVIAVDRIEYYYGDVGSPTEQLERLIRTYEVGDVVTFEVYRSGKKITVQVELIEYIPSDSSVDFE